MSNTFGSDHLFASEGPKSGFYGAHFRFSTSLRRNAIKSTFLFEFNETLWLHSKLVIFDRVKRAKGLDEYFKSY